VSERRVRFQFKGKYMTIRAAACTVYSRSAGAPHRLVSNPCVQHGQQLEHSNGGSGSKGTDKGGSGQQRGKSEESEGSRTRVPQARSNTLPCSRPSRPAEHQTSAPRMPSATGPCDNERAARIIQDCYRRRLRERALSLIKGIIMARESSPHPHASAFGVNRAGAKATMQLLDDYGAE
jgi:hypothetical protein